MKLVIVKAAHIDDCGFSYCKIGGKSATYEGQPYYEINERQAQDFIAKNKLIPRGGDLFDEFGDICARIIK
ncbi:MAG: hypothetical protein ABIH41_03100 [Nanoarchaeota archaeon]